MSTVITLYSSQPRDRHLTFGCLGKCRNRYGSSLCTPAPSFKIEKINEPVIMIFKVVSDEITVLSESECVKCKMGAASAPPRQRRAGRGRRWAQLDAGWCTRRKGGNSALTRTRCHRHPKAWQTASRVGKSWISNVFASSKKRHLTLLALINLLFGKDPEAGTKGSSLEGHQGSGRRVEKRGEWALY